MTSDVASFTKELYKFNKVVEKACTDHVVKLHMSMTYSIVSKTPIDTGRSRANWKTTLNKTTSAYNYNAFDPSRSLSTNAQVLSGYKLGDTVWLSNSIDYVGDLERGSSRQAPQGMVGITANAFAQLYGMTITR